MKKLKLLLPLALGTFVLASCGGTVNTKPFAPGSEPAANLYAFQAATSIGLLGNVSTPSGIRMAQDPDKEANLISEIEKYLPSVEAALSGMDALTSAKEEASDREGFETKLVISYQDIALVNNEFVMYYNETLKIDDDKEDEDEKDATVDTTTPSDTQLDPAPLNAADSNEDSEAKAEDEEDQEQESEINGIILVGENEYAMHGEKELDPVENEYEVSFTYSLDENTFVTVEQEIENDETEFEYKIESNGKTIYEYSIEVETDEVELEVKEAGVGKTKYGFEIVEKDGKTLIKATHKVNGDKSTFYFEKIVNEEDQSVSYQIVK